MAMPYVCASCGSETDQLDACGECGEPARLDGRFRLEELLGRGSSGITYRATRLEDDRIVCIKELSYSAMNSFEAKELFEREAKVLRQLDHRAIPAYLDFFSMEEGKNLSLYLVQEYVDGRSLEAEMTERRYSEDEILALLEELVDVLVYLQDLRPPVFHRDIKPSNVMRSTDDRIVLVDFGSVKATTDGATGGSTIAGTFGYMAPEQHWGRAEPQTDVYGLGALGLALLSRRDPSEFVGSNHKLDWHGEIDASPPMESLLDDLLAHDLENRPEDAAAARDRIRQARKRLESGEPVEEKSATSTPQAESPPDESDAPSAMPAPMGGAPVSVTEPGEPPSETPAVPVDDGELITGTSTGGEPLSGRAGTWTAWIVIGFVVVVMGLLYASSQGMFDVEMTAGVPVERNVCAGDDCLPLGESSFREFPFGASRADLRERGMEFTDISSKVSHSDAVYRTSSSFDGQDMSCRLFFDGPDGGCRRIDAKSPSPTPTISSRIPPAI